MQQLKQKIIPQLVVIYTRYLIGGAFVFASLIKIKGQRFTSESGALHPIDTAWHFFETLYQSGLYWQFIGVGQLLAGFLLMTQRFSKLGAIVNFPIILNIFIVTLSYDFAYTPVITGLMLLANMLLLIWEWDTLKTLFNLKPNIEVAKQMEQDHFWQITGLLLFSFTFGYRLLIDAYNLVFWALICLLLGFFAFPIGLYRHNKRHRTLETSVKG